MYAGEREKEADDVSFFFFVFENHRRDDCAFCSFASDLLTIVSRQSLLSSLRKEESMVENPRGIGFNAAREDPAYIIIEINEE